MTTAFPAGLDALTNPASTDQMDSVTVPHSVQHSTLNDAVEALEAKVGITSSAVPTSLDYKIRNLDTASLVSGVLALARIPTLLAASTMPSLALDGAAGTERQARYSTAGALRWLAMAGNVAESGGNAGSGYLIRAYADDGTTIIDTPLSITRAAGGAIALARPLTLLDGGTVSLGATTGTTLGGASDKAGFFGATPIVQPIGTTDLRTALINLGLYASGGATPLNLNGGSLTAGIVNPAAGAVGTPSLYLASDTSTGWFRSGANAWAWGGAGVERQRFTTAGDLISCKNSAGVSGLSSVSISSDAASYHSADSTDISTSYSSYAGNAAIIARVLGGTGATPAVTAAGQTFTLSFRGFNSTVSTSDRASIIMAATELWGASNAGTSIAIKVTKDTTTSTVAAVTFAYPSTASAPTSVFAGQVTVAGLAINDATDIALGTTTGTKIGTATTQKLGFYGVTPIVQKTGYGTPTGNAYQASFAAGAITLPNLAAGVAQLILDLKAAGLIGT